MISYEELSQVFDMDNPLTLEYFELCNKDTDEPKYFEKHHILPKSIWPEHNKCKWNKVKLTYQDHYRAHEILALGICLHKNSHVKMLHAWNVLAHQNNIIIDADIYSRLKKERIDIVSGILKKQGGIMKGLRGAKHPFYGKKFSKEHRANLVIAHTGKNISESHRLSLSNALLGRSQSKEHAEKAALAKLKPLVIDGQHYTSVGDAKDKLKTSDGTLDKYRRGTINTLRVSYAGNTYMSIGLMAETLGVHVNKANRMIRTELA